METIQKPTFINQSDKKKSKIFIVLSVLVILAIIAAIVIFTRNKPGNKTETTITPTQEQPSPTEKPEIAKDAVKIQVLNGTGTEGQAGKVVELLSTDYNKDNIKTDNASDYDHTLTTISTKTGYDEIASDIKMLLSEMFDSVKIESSDLETDNEFDIVITTGQKPSPTSTPSAGSSSSSSSQTTTPTPTTTMTPTPTPTLTPTPTP